MTLATRAPSRSARPRAGHANYGSCVASWALSWQREDVERAALLRVARQILHRRGETEGRRRIARIEIASDDAAGPAADAGDHRDVLLAVGPAIRDRLADDPRAGAILPERLPV